MNWLAERMLALSDWGSLPTLTGPATAIPFALRDLASSESPESARAAYWRLDNYVIVQGQLFEAALPVVPVLLALLSADDLSLWARERTLELLFQIAVGIPHPTEAAAGNVELASRCRAAVAEGKWLYYRQLLELYLEVPNVRGFAIDLLVEFESDRPMLLSVLGRIAVTDRDMSIRSIARDRIEEIRRDSAT